MALLPSSLARKEAVKELASVADIFTQSAYAGL
jgi:hypothetical protein